MKAVPSGRVSMTMPARPDYVAVARGVVIAAGERSGLSLDSLDDLTLAVDELCGAALAVADGGELRIDMDPDPGQVTLRVEVDAAPEEWPVPGWDRSLAGQVLEALVSEVAFAVEGPRAVITAVKTA